MSFSRELVRSICFRIWRVRCAVMFIDKYYRRPGDFRSRSYMSLSHLFVVFLTIYSENRVYEEVRLAEKK
jgi:hypothetical protein